MIGKLPTGTRGIDCNATLSGPTAAKFYAAGYRFVVRYVRRAAPHSFDLTPLELATILRAGLAVMVVQHVAAPGWHPTELLGRVYGDVAAREAHLAGVSLGVTLWCDLEEVSKEATPADVIDYCNAWYDTVRAAGYKPGLYVGYGCGLSAWQLYHRLKFSAYWASYNLDHDKYPAVRGVQMRQFAATSADRVPGVAFECDVNVIGQDAKGDSPVVLLATRMLADVGPGRDA